MLPERLARQAAKYFRLAVPAEPITALATVATVEIDRLDSRYAGLLVRRRDTYPRWLALVNATAIAGPRLAAAHLLGAYYLRSRQTTVIVCTFEPTTPAGWFADELIMPASVVRMLRGPTTEAMAARFGVPLEQLKRRRTSLRVEEEEGTM